MSLGLVYEGVAFLCCRGVVVAAPVGWYPTPVPVAWGCRARRTRRAPGSGLPRARPGWSAWRFRGVQLRPGTGGTDVPMVCIPAGSVRIPHGLVDVETLGTAILNARDYDESISRDIENGF